MNDDSGRKRVRVLVVDDSPVVRELIVYLLEADPWIQVIGTAANGAEALQAVKQKSPDVVTMDYHMPTLNGLDATRQIMETHPVPIVIVSGSSARDEVAFAFRLLEAGALAVVEKPLGIGQAGHAAAARLLVQTVKLMAEVKVVRRWPKRIGGGSAASARPGGERQPVQAGVRGVVIGASTGGPVVLKTILSGLPKDFPVPILIVQHIADGFAQGLVEWLARTTGFPVHLASHDAYPLPGHAYVAPSGSQMKLAPDGALVLNGDAPENGHRPSVSYLFRSVAATWGRQAIGVLLTGMGRDGAEELKLIKEKGAVTIAQDFKTSVVHGMPGVAIELNAATHILSPDEIAAVLGNLAK
ncbi:MAG: chemotaxis-specific protein-glutamate methyltransferase CheB [Polaromonas sp.]